MPLQVAQLSFTVSYTWPELVERREELFRRDFVSGGQTELQRGNDPVYTPMDSIDITFGKKHVLHNDMSEDKKHLVE